MPQGSHLGPLLFNILIDSIQTVTTNTLSLFADDSNILCISPPTTTITAHLSQIETDLAACISWAEHSGSSFNVSKCAHIVFHSGRTTAAERTVQMNEASLCRPEAHRHLGVILTPSLDFREHIRSIISKFRSRVFLLSRMALFFPRSIISILYKSYIRPTLEYSIPVWFSSLTVQDQDSMSRLQASATRGYLAAKLGRKPDWMTPKENLNQRAGWEAIKWRLQILSLCYFHHIVYTFPSVLFDFKFRFSSSSRHPKSLVLPPTGNYFAKSFLFLIAVAWKKLPADIRSLDSPTLFNRQVRKLYEVYRFSVSGIPSFTC